MAEQLSGSERLKFISNSLNTLGKVATYHRLRQSALDSVREFEELLDGATRSFPAPEGWEYTVEPERHTRKLTIGRYYPANSAHCNEANIVGFNETECPEAYVFAGNLLVSTYSGLLVVQESDQPEEGEDPACIVPNLPLVYLGLRIAG